MDSFPLNQRYPPYTESKKSLMTKLLKVGFVTYRQIGKALLVLIVLVVLIVLGCVFLPSA